MGLRACQSIPHSTRFLEGIPPLSPCRGLRPAPERRNVESAFFMPIQRPHRLLGIIRAFALPYFSLAIRLGIPPGLLITGLSSPKTHPSCRLCDRPTHTPTVTRPQNNLQEEGKQGQKRRQDAAVICKWQIQLRPDKPVNKGRE